MKRLSLRVCVLAICAPLFSSCAAGTASLPPGSASSDQSVVVSGSSITVSGTIVALISNGFQIQSGPSCGYLNVHTTSSTTYSPAGARPAVGLFAQATGTGSCSAAGVTATQVTLGSNVAKHVLTGAYLYSKDGVTSHGRAFSAYSASLNWAETYSGSAVSSAGIKTIYYTNPNRIASNDPLYTSDESAFAHTCTGTRIHQTGSTTVYYLTNPASSTYVNRYKTQVNAELSKQHFDAIFDDEPFDWYALSGMPCNYNASTWMSAYVNEAKALGHPVIYNGLGILGSGGALSPSIGMNAGAMGGMAEACYSASWNPHLSSGSDWRGLENTEIAMQQQNKLFICYSNNLTSAASAIGIRLYVYASFLLTYDLRTSLLWEYFGTTSGYTVEPESQLVAASPAVSTPSSVTSLLTSTGVYGRRYNTCYIAGKSIGACAAVVNPDSVNSHAFPYTGYHHTLLLSGGGILDGGTISALGSAPPSRLAPLTAVIATQ